MPTRERFPLRLAFRRRVALWRDKTVDKTADRGAGKRDEIHSAASRNQKLIATKERKDRKGKTP